MATQPNESKQMFRRVLSSLNNAGQVADSAADDVAHQFIDHSISSESHSNFSKFDPTTDNVDTLLYAAMASNQQFTQLWSVISRLLILSHGQASVERGFSYNRQIEADNMSEKSFIAMRFICDSVRSLGGDIMNVPITKEMLISVKSAHQKYKTYLEQTKKSKSEEERGVKRKQEENKLDDLRKRKKLLISDMGHLNSSADELASKATKTVKSEEMRQLINKSVSFRNTAKEKEDELRMVESSIKDQEEVVKQI